MESTVLILPDHGRFFFLFDIKTRILSPKFDVPFKIHSILIPKLSEDFLFAIRVISDGRNEMEMPDFSITKMTLAIQRTEKDEPKGGEQKPQSNEEEAKTELRETIWPVLRVSGEFSLSGIPVSFESFEEELASGLTMFDFRDSEDTRAKINENSKKTKKNPSFDEEKQEEKNEKSKGHHEEPKCKDDPIDAEQLPKTFEKFVSFKCTYSEQLQCFGVFSNFQRNPMFFLDQNDSLQRLYFKNLTSSNESHIIGCAFVPEDLFSLVSSSILKQSLHPLALVQLDKKLQFKIQLFFPGSKQPKSGFDFLNSIQVSLDPEKLAQDLKENEKDFPIGIHGKMVRGKVRKFLEMVEVSKETTELWDKINKIYEENRPSENVSSNFTRIQEEVQKMDNFREKCTGIFEEKERVKTGIENLNGIFGEKMDEFPRKPMENLKKAVFANEKTREDIKEIQMHSERTKREVLWKITALCEFFQRIKAHWSSTQKAEKQNLEVEQILQGRLMFFGQNVDGFLKEAKNGRANHSNGRLNESVQLAGEASNRGETSLSLKEREKMAEMLRMKTKGNSKKNWRPSEPLIWPKYEEIRDSLRKNQEERIEFEKKKRHFIQFFEENHLPFCKNDEEEGNDSEDSSLVIKDSDFIMDDQDSQNSVQMDVSREHHQDPFEETSGNARNFKEGVPDQKEELAKKQLDGWLFGMDQPVLKQNQENPILKINKKQISDSQQSIFEKKDLENLPSFRLNEPTPSDFGSALLLANPKNGTKETMEGSKHEESSKETKITKSLCPKANLLPKIVDNPTKEEPKKESFFPLKTNPIAPLQQKTVEPSSKEEAKPNLLSFPLEPSPKSSLASHSNPEKSLSRPFFVIQVPNQAKPENEPNTQNTGPFSFFTANDQPKIQNSLMATGSQKPRDFFFSSSGNNSVFSNNLFKLDPSPKVNLPQIPIIQPQKPPSARLNDSQSNFSISGNQPPLGPVFGQTSSIAAPNLGSFNTGGSFKSSASVFSQATPHTQLPHGSLLGSGNIQGNFSSSFFNANPPSVFSNQPNGRVNQMKPVMSLQIRK